MLTQCPKKVQRKEYCKITETENGEKNNVLKEEEKVAMVLQV